ncbi:MAG: FAD-dependent oxidoreductase [Chloroflexi bacterium]|nr:FAD-dependent oxidoreductase [Chloroflexota bacterium]
MNGRSVIVIGGGLAGIAAACELADAGQRVTLLEKRPFLGGRAYSYTDGRSGREVDNGQHVFLKCCTEYIRLLERLGVRGRTYLQERMRVPVVDKLTGRSVLEAGRLPAPFHLLPTFLRYRPLSLGEKLLAAYALTRMRSLDRSRHPELDGVTFSEWLRAQGQTSNAVRNFWNLIIQPTLNDGIERVSADLAIMVFQEGFLRTKDGGNIGWAKVGLSQLLAEAAARHIEERGGEVRLRVGVQRLVVEDGRLAGVVVDGETLASDGYVSALPHDALLAVLPASARKDSYFARLSRIETSPIVNVHLWYDRPVTSVDFAAFLNTPLQWLFNKSKLWEQDGPGEYLDISLSGAHDFVELPGQELIEMFRREVGTLFPVARAAELKNALVVKQPRATFAPRPGIAALRPDCGRTPIESLFLAGDWSQTGWPATMESAVRSGLLAARDVIAAAGREVRAEAIAV